MLIEQAGASGGAVKSSFQELLEVGFLPETCTLGRPMGKAVPEVSQKFLTFKSYMRHKKIDEYDAQRSIFDEL